MSRPAPVLRLAPFPLASFHLAAFLGAAVLLVTPLLAAGAAGAPETRRQSFTISCARETVFFTVTARGPEPGKKQAGTKAPAPAGLEVSPLAVRDRAGSIPFTGMRRGEAAGTIVFTWADTTAGAEPYTITIPWADEEKQTLDTNEDRITCARGAGEEIFPPFDEPPVVIKLYPPDYPESAKQARIEGVVYVRMTIAESGRVIAANVQRSETIAALDAAAVEAAKLSIFRPAMKGGAPVKARVILPFRFKL